MTYCVGITLQDGLIFASDSRTNAGVDNIASFCKMRMFERPGERALVTLTSGNLAISQGTVNLLQQQARDPNRLNLWNCQSMYDAANLLGDALRETQQRDGPYLSAKNIDPSSWFIIGGQIAGEPPRLFMVYAEGNCIEASQETPFFQIGETKYGKPILDRVITQQTSLIEASKCVVVSFDSTMRSNISVGPPIDLAVIPRDQLRISMHRRFMEGDPYMQMIHREWGEGLKRAFAQLPEPEWVDDGHPRSTAP
jgi:putative proteasome-type protease